jgi:hypothetical protein
MMITNFSDTQAFKLGIIDARGNTIRKTSQLKTDAEKDAFDYLHRLVFNMKKIINKIGGENKLKSMATALWLVKENYTNTEINLTELENKFKRLIESNVHLVEEEILVGRLLIEDGVGVGAIGGAPANNTSGPVATQEPKIYPKSKKKPIFGMARRSSLAIKEIK